MRTGSRPPGPGPQRTAGGQSDGVMSQLAAHPTDPPRTGLPMAYLRTRTGAWTGLISPTGRLCALRPRRTAIRGSCRSGSDWGAGEPSPSPRGGETVPGETAERTYHRRRRQGPSGPTHAHQDTRPPSAPGSHLPPRFRCHLPVQHAAVAVAVALRSNRAGLPSSTSARMPRRPRGCRVVTSRDCRSAARQFACFRPSRQTISRASRVRSSIRAPSLPTAHGWPRRMGCADECTRRLDAR